MKLFLVSLLRLYRVIISPLWGPCCRFYPSCSRYAEEAIATRGVVSGMRMAAKRILRCHPFHPGGFDPVE